MNKKIIAIIAIAAVIVISVGIFSAINREDVKEPATESTSRLNEEDPFNTTGIGEGSAPVEERSNRVSASITSGEAVFTYDGSPIELEYEFTCQRACKMGLVIYLNGVLQPYSVEGNESIMHTVELGDEDVKSFKLSFTPVCGKAGEELSIWFTNIYNPSILELEGNVNTFGNNQKLSQANSKRIKFNVDSPEKDFNVSNSYSFVKMTDEEIKGFERNNTDGTSYSILDENCIVEIRKAGEVLSGNAVLESGGFEKVSLYIYGNAEGKYKVYLFGDFKALGINGKDFAEVEVKKDEYTVIALSSEDEKLLECKNIYAVAAPEDSQNYVIKSASLYVKEK